MRTPRTFAGLALVTLALLLSACGSDEGGESAQPVAASASPEESTPTAPDPAASLGVHDLDDVVAQYHLKAVPDDNYYIATLPDGTECDVTSVMTSRSDVEFSMQMGDVVATNADMSIGFLVGDDQQATCLNGLSVMLGYQP